MNGQIEAEVGAKNLASLKVACGTYHTAGETPRAPRWAPVLVISINAMSQAEGFYLCLSVCICGSIDGAVDEAGGGEARKLASCRLQVGDPPCLNAALDG